MAETETKHGLRKIAGVLVPLIAACAAVVFLLDLAGAFGTLELKARDAFFHLGSAVTTPTDTDSAVVLVEIDDKTLKDKTYRIPRLLWHHYFASVIRGLADGGAKVVGLDFPLPQAKFDDLAPGYSRTWREALEYARSKNARIVTGVVGKGNLRPIPEVGYLEAMGPNSVGLLNITPDSDGFCRRQRLIFPGSGGGTGAYSVAWQLAKAYRPSLERPADAITIDFNAGRNTMARFSFADVHRKAEAGDAAFLTKNFRNRIVLIGETDSLTPDRRPTPLDRAARGAGGGTPGLVIRAHAIHTLLAGRTFTEIPVAGRLLIYLALAVAVALYTTLGSRRTTLIFLPALVLVFLLAAFGAYMAGLFLPVAGGVAAVLIGQALFFGYRRLSTEREREAVNHEFAQTTRNMGLDFQSQGKLDQAFEKFRQIPVDEDMKEILYRLGLDYEQKRLFNEAKAVYEYIGRHDPSFKDIEARIKKIGIGAGTMIVPTGSQVDWGEAAELDLDGDTRPTLGRYEVIEVLGQGAMGTVYLGKDPKIGRMTAIKTVRFADEYESAEAGRIKAQFFREAETAGGLSHPNIVTIYDAGEENDLSYIAMELLDGHDLKDHTSPNTLLPMRRVLEVVAQVADALGYAHEKGVVHRDVKPANIMLLKNGKVKVADFGVARVMASSVTKTGVIKGTPFYMSPEQIMGKKVDGRSDIFALGVVLYELLCGALPFQADELEALIFKVTTENHEPVTRYNRRVPKVLNQIIAKALVKDRDQRYPKAGVLAKHLRFVGEKMDEAAAKGKVKVVRPKPKKKK